MHLFESIIGTLLRPVRSTESKLMRGNAQFAQCPNEISVGSLVLKNGEAVPRNYSIEGHGSFPGITWDNLPEGTKSLLLVVEDNDAPLPSPFVHLLAYNIDPDMKALPEGSILREGANPLATIASIRLGKNTVGKTGYLPPSPPAHHGTHHYHFQLFAIDQKLSFGKTPSLSDMKALVEGHVLGWGELMSTYEKL